MLCVISNTVCCEHQKPSPTINTFGSLLLNPTQSALIHLVQVLLPGSVNHDRTVPSRNVQPFQRDRGTYTWRDTLWKLFFVVVIFV